MPTAHKIAIIDNVVTLAHTLRPSNPAFAWLNTYTNPFSNAKPSSLLISGQEEHYQLAQRLARASPSIFNTYDTDAWTIQSTCISRAMRSATSFAFGAFEVMFYS